MKPILAGLVVGVFLLISAKYAVAIDFSITNPVIAVNAEGTEEISIDASISGSTSSYYLQGKLRVSGSTYYFGQTRNNYGDFVPYMGSPSPTEIVTNFHKTVPQGNVWSDKIVIKNDPDDPNYKGPGDYDLFLERYTGSSSNPASTAGPLSVHLSFALSTPTPTATPIPSSPTPTATPTSKPIVPTSTPTPKPLATPTPRTEEAVTEEEKTIESSPTTTEGGQVVSPIPETKGVATSSGKLGSRKDLVIPLVITGLGLGLIGAAVVMIVKENRHR